MNTFNDDSYDSASEKCTIYTYSLLGGLMGCVGGFISGYYAVLMKITGTVYMFICVRSLYETCVVRRGNMS